MAVPRVIPPIVAEETLVETMVEIAIENATPTAIIRNKVIASGTKLVAARGQTQGIVPRAARAAILKVDQVAAKIDAVKTLGNPTNRKAAAGTLLRLIPLRAVGRFGQTEPVVSIELDRKRPLRTHANAIPSQRIIDRLEIMPIPIVMAP